MKGVTIDQVMSVSIPQRCDLNSSCGRHRKMLLSFNPATVRFESYKNTVGAGQVVSIPQRCDLNFNEGNKRGDIAFQSRNGAI